MTIISPFQLSPFTLICVGAFPFSELYLYFEFCYLFARGIISDVLIFSKRSVSLKPLRNIILKMKKSNLVFPNKNATYTIMRGEAHPSES